VKVVFCLHLGQNWIGLRPPKTKITTSPFYTYRQMVSSAKMLRFCDICPQFISYRTLTGLLSGDSVCHVVYGWWRCSCRHLFVTVHPRITARPSAAAAAGHVWCQAGVRRHSAVGPRAPTVRLDQVHVRGMIG